ncbi:glycosyltransferase family 2 protein [Gluconobacter kanchanaburiensis]|uniref:Uncharacterized protein n=1 Tax=Gluconobacter kanchanaburiensis NBRC 103587 TaxID=1307948 RepID=A0A511BI39_9PROT|nr:glycosyltransferase [Gluconobacter kanchanaburiensis]MBF0862236.1 glycosyltransferase [Gluconobacter kanchanaburiensis]GEK97477.1 hypothetical protein GKA01_26740 [Gluconobacter kanchanaburiensis NBRC 103587]
MTNDFVIYSVNSNGILKTTTFVNHDEIDDVVWYVFVDSKAKLHPDIGKIIVHNGHVHRDVEIFYGDEVCLSKDNRTVNYLCKPSFDRTLFLSQEYMGLPVAIRARSIGNLIPDYNVSYSRLWLYEVCVRAVVGGTAVERITEVLAVHPEGRSELDPIKRRDIWRKVASESLALADCEIVTGLQNNLLQLRRNFTLFPHVTLVIPTRQSVAPAEEYSSSLRPMILNLLDSLDNTDWPKDRMKVLVGDDLEDGSIYAENEYSFEFQRIVTHRAETQNFNYASKMNALWKAVDGEYIVFLNDDIQVRSPGWLHALMTFAVDKSVGGVGARLLYPDGRLQHVGMPGGAYGPCTHVFIGMQSDEKTYQDWAIVQREWSMVTGAVFATRRSTLEQLDGFDESFPLDYNDVDLCLRMRLVGLRVVYTPYSELIHFESATRGRKFPAAEYTAIFYEKWKSYICDDPSYHPHLSRNSPLISPNFNTNDWWNCFV